MLEDGFSGENGINRADYAAAYTYGLPHVSYMMSCVSSPPRVYMYVFCSMCYNMCTQRSPHNWSEQLYGRHREVTPPRPHMPSYATLPSLQPYIHWHQAISNYLTNTVLVSLEPRRDEALLKELSRRWENHRIMNKWMKNFFRYLVSSPSHKFDIAMSIYVCIHAAPVKSRRSPAANLDTVLFQDRYQVNYNNELPLMASGLALFRTIIYCNEPLRHNVTAAILAMVEEVGADVVVEGCDMWC